MDEIGIDLSRHRPKSFDNLEDTSFDLIISLSPEAQHQAVELTRTMACDVEFWNTFDPTLVEGNRATRLQAYRDVRDQLKRRIEERFTFDLKPQHRSEEHTSELQSLMRISYAVLCLKKKKTSYK